MSESHKNIVAIVVVLVALFLAQRQSDVVPPDVDPQPTPSAILGPGLNVFIAEETENRLSIPKEQLDILTSNDWRAAVIANGGAIRQLDPTDKHPNDLAKWQTALARPRTGLPWCIVSNGVNTYEGLLPSTRAEWDALLLKYGGMP